MTDDEKLAKEIREAARRLNELIGTATDAGLRVNVETPRERTYIVGAGEVVEKSPVHVRVTIAKPL